MVLKMSNKENWLYPEASGLYFPHDGFIMRASDGKQYDYEEECELLNEYDKKYNEYRNDVLRLEKENEQLNNENKSFKAEIEQLKKCYNNVLDEMDTLAEVNDKTYKENKELKSLCKVLITHIKKKSIAFVIDEDVRRLLE